MSNPEPTVKLVPSTQLWRRFATPEQEQQIEAAIQTDIFAMVGLFDLERRLEEREYGCCDVCQHVLNVLGMCHNCREKAQRGQQV